MEASALEVQTNPDNAKTKGSTLIDNVLMCLNAMFDSSLTKLSCLRSIRIGGRAINEGLSPSH